MLDPQNIALTRDIVLGDGLLLAAFFIAVFVHFYREDRRKRQ
jgi:hypothetical protein